MTNPIQLQVDLDKSNERIQAAANYDETRVPEYVLPDLLRSAGGQKVCDAKTWKAKRRPEILGLFEEHIYGKAPGRPEKMTFKIRSVNEKALGGKATQKEVVIAFMGRDEGPKMDLLIYLPNGQTRPVPIFLTLNFFGNHTIHPDPGITLSKSWMRHRTDKVSGELGHGVINHQATEASRGTKSSGWSVEKILERGYALATIYYGDIDPDDWDRSMGIQTHYLKKGQEKPTPNEWGSISAWAWGLSRGMDYLETDKDINSKRVIVMGHSRLGKTSLWAGAQDERFAITISNNSGCGGAALSRRCYGETLNTINYQRGYWFCGNHQQYSSNEDKLPVDQHMLIALMAPRPVYIASAIEDRWADPKGEFLSGKHAQPVYRLFGIDDEALDEMPEINKPIMGYIGYHIRSGGHGVTDYDWDRYMGFADYHFKEANR